MENSNTHEVILKIGKKSNIFNLKSNIFFLKIPSQQLGWFSFFHLSFSVNEMIWAACRCRTRIWSRKPIIKWDALNGCWSISVCECYTMKSCIIEARREALLLVFRCPWRTLVALLLLFLLFSLHIFCTYHVLSLFFLISIVLQILCSARYPLFFLLSLLRHFHIDRTFFLLSCCFLLPLLTASKIFHRTMHQNIFCRLLLISALSLF